jgi:hypothetical protein
VASNLTDYIPHGMVAAFAAVVSWVYREHVKLDDKRYDAIGEKLDKLADKMADNHTELLSRLLDAKGQAVIDFKNRRDA